MLLLCMMVVRFGSNLDKYYDTANRFNDYPKSHLLRKGQLFHQYLQAFLAYP